MEQSLFSLLIIDTPNQQGQDTENLSNIYSILDLLISKEGQVILGSERDTGIEEKAANIVRLNESRQCLSKDSFDNHKEFFSRLENLDGNIILEEKVKESSDITVEIEEKKVNLADNQMKKRQISIFDNIK